MVDIVIVPTYDRPEYLWVCLEKLHDAEGVQDKEIWVCEDNHIPEKDGWAQINMIPTLAYWEKQLPIRYFARMAHNTYGNSLNVIEAMRDACRRGKNGTKIYLVEDDVMVLPDFFKWHEAVQEAESFHCVSCAERYNHSLNFALNGQYVLDETLRDSMAYIVKRNVYSSLGVCFPIDVLSHFARVQRWPADYGPGNEQDIIIKDYLNSSSTNIIWPYVPRCYHMGWYGYHRNTGMRFNGSLEEKVKALKAAMINPARIREMAGAQDIEAYPTKPIVWTDGDVYSIEKYR